MLKKHLGLMASVLAVCSTNIVAATFILPNARDDIGSVIIGISSGWTGNVMGNDEYGNSVSFKRLEGNYGYLSSVTTSGDYTYTAYPGVLLAPGEKAQDVFPYTLRNTTGQSDDAQLVITISADPSNSLPDAKDDIGSIVIGVNSTWTGNVMANDENGDSVSFQRTEGNYGYLDDVGSFLSSGSYIYRAYPDIFLAPGETAQDVFPYTLKNNTGQSYDANLIINIRPNPSVPEAINDQFTLVQNTSSIVTGNMTANDQGGNSFSFTESPIGEYGFLIVDSDGGFTYTLDENSPKALMLTAREVVTDVFSYEYKNTLNGLSDTGQLTIQIIGNPVDANGNTIFEQEEDLFDNVDIEPNNRSKDATPLNSGRNIKGHLHSSSDKDWFTIPRTGNETVSLDVCPQGTACYGKKSWVLYVFDKDKLTEEMETRSYTFQRWLNETGSTVDLTGDVVIDGVSSAGSSNHLYLAYNLGFFDNDEGGALIGIVDPCYDTSNSVDIGVNSAKTGSALLVAVSSPLARDGGGCSDGSVVLEQAGADALGTRVAIGGGEVSSTYSTTEEYIVAFPYSDDQYTINVTITDQDPLASEIATAQSASYSADSGVLTVPRARVAGKTYEATLSQLNDDEAIRFILSEISELSIEEVVDAYRATFNEEKQQVVIPRVTVAETGEAFSVILQYYPAVNGNEAWFEVYSLIAIE